MQFEPRALLLYHGGSEAVTACTRDQLRRRLSVGTLRLLRVRKIPEFIGHCQRKPEISCRGTSGLAGIPGGGSGRLNALGATSLTVSG